MTAIKSVVADAKRIVIKVGTALLTDNGRGLDEKAIANPRRRAFRSAEARPRGGSRLFRLHR